MIGGFIVKNTTETPYVVSIQIQRDPSKNGWEPVCAGSVLSALYVITACHCVAKTSPGGSVESLVEDFPLASWLFLAGAVDVTYPTWMDDRLAQNRTPKYIRHHPNCSLCQHELLFSDVTVYDVALARMSEPFDLSAYVKPVELFNFYPNIFNQKLSYYLGKRNLCVISGWDSSEPRNAMDDFRVPNQTSAIHTKTTETPLLDYKLKKVIVSVLQDDAHCFEDMYRDLGKTVKLSIHEWNLTSRRLQEYMKGQMCGFTKSEGPCDTDFGAGLVCDNKFILGVSSWGIGCGNYISSVVQNMVFALTWLEDECCTFNNCQDVLYAIDQCEDPEEGKFHNCSFPTTTAVTAAKTVTMSGSEPIEVVTAQQHSPALTSTPNKLVLLAFYLLVNHAPSEF